MTKINVLPLGISPISLVCPLCSAPPGKACGTTAGLKLKVVHVSRIKEAAAKDAARAKSE
jgi:hypothetical protein